MGQVFSFESATSADVPPLPEVFHKSSGTSDVSESLESAAESNIRVNSSSVSSQTQSSNFKSMASSREAAFQPSVPLCLPKSASGSAEPSVLASDEKTETKKQKLPQSRSRHVKKSTNSSAQTADDKAFLDELTREAVQLAKAGNQKTTKKQTKKITVIGNKKSDSAKCPPQETAPAASAAPAAPADAEAPAVDEEGWERVVAKSRRLSNSTTSTSFKSASFKKPDLALSAEASLKAVKKAISRASALAAAAKASEVVRPSCRPDKAKTKAGSGNHRAVSAVEAETLVAVSDTPEKPADETETAVEVKTLSKAITKTVEVAAWKTNFLKFAPLAKKPRGAVISSLTVAYTVAK